MSTEDVTEKIIDKTTKLGIHKDIVAPFIGLVTISTIAWVAVLIILGRD
jgi:hypothetical protein